MADNAHIILLQGEDEAAISEFLDERLKTTGDPTLASMNIARLDGRTHSHEMLAQAIHSLPFLAERRVVIFENPTDKVRSPQQQTKLLEIIEKCPPSTLLVLVERRLLTNEKDRKNKRAHWLDRWAESASGRVETKICALPGGPQLGQWIQNRARRAGGQFNLAAASALAAAIGPDSAILEQEIQKLLTYVNFARPVEVDDVQNLARTIRRPEDFALVNALRAHNVSLALKMLRIDLAEYDPLQILGSITSQFRNLLLVREQIELSKSEQEIAAVLKIHPFVVKLTIDNARRFTLKELENIYRRLLETDEAIKSSAMPADLALEVLVTELAG